jgi:hypothetical protein
MSNLRLPDKYERARAAALEDLKRFEESGPIVLASDRALVARLKSDDYGWHVGWAWFQMEKVWRRSDDGYQLIVAIFGAWHHAIEAPSLHEAFAHPLEDFPVLKWCADHLIAFIQSGRVEATGPETTANVDQTIRLLQWWRGMFERGEQDISVRLSALGLSRKSKDQSVACLSVFLFRLSEFMRKNFGNEMVAVVAQLACVVFNQDVTRDQGYRALRTRKERR